MGLSVLQYFREYFHGGWRSAHLTGLGSYIVFALEAKFSAMLNPKAGWRLRLKGESLHGR
uniref:Uncharacterized protein n=1 Tax=Gossypium raimondii TaxID=29730 RepID=A0A0D2TLN8_GOSRA|nr:hypothetical protein B456_009G079900 [Gossypium raimondii]